ncbi:Xaa-Pro dipeptidase [Chryseomicrobium excrementi]|uniref:Xaa-Pro dipeptidase n=1 Tax=Chryseomicrobium excrementi TaxID=2041346 RepID=A0A2M9F2B9_9BACL|nr:Xaa-Pro peptidase family protein [Chryseomicrobium excrementi]PJK17601.1 Xaa-Pro dipeptidase [Chryseomicrobium excrementi]
MKLKKLRQALQQADLPALLVTSAHSRRYLTGFTGTAGVAVITANEAFFITDFRYTEQANDQIEGYEIIEQKTTLIEAVAQLVEDKQLTKLGFEQDAMTYAEYDRYANALKAELVPTSGLVEKIRLIKTEDELTIIKQACKIADDAYEHILTFIKPGMTELEVSNELEFFMRKQGATSSSFDIIVASGTRSALPHGVATDKVIESGDFVTLDFGAYYNGYVSDVTRTLAVGQPSDKLKEIYQVVLDSQLLALEKIKPGMTGKEVDAISRDYIASKGYGEAFGHSLGHGIGLEVHEGPGLSSRSDVVLEPGMVITIEPGIYLPGIGGVRIEDDALVTETGVEKLTHTSKELVIL